MSVQFEVNVKSTGVAEVDQLSNKLGGAAVESNKLTTALKGIGDTAFAINNIRSALDGIANDFMSAVQPGIAYNSSLTELSSITGVTGDALKSIGDKARQNAKDFGVDAAASVDTFTIFLSKLSPELAKNEEALSSMGVTATQLSKQLKGDTAAAAGILSTAMNQYGVKMDDPLQASAEMARMMNTMSAAAREGSATLPNIQGALQQSGLMAKTTGVQFEELNAAIQVLDKAGKSGSEGGVAIRNVLGIMSQGDKMTKSASDSLSKYGINVAALGDKNLTLSQRLAMLKPMLGDTSAMMAVFGTENAAAAMALVQGTTEMDRLTAAVTGTNAGVEIAEVQMTSWEERLKKTNAWFKDLGITLFENTEGFIPFVQMGGQGLHMMTNLGGAVNAFGILSQTSAVKGIIATTVALGTWIGSTITATAAQWGLNIALNANPIGLVVIAVAAAIGAVVLLVKHWDIIKEKIWQLTQFLWEHHPFKWLIDVVDKIFPGFKAQMTVLWDWIKGRFEALLGWFTEVWDKVKSFFGSSDSPQAAVKLATLPTATLPSGDGKDDNDGKTDPKFNTKLGNATATSIAGGGTRNNVITLHIGKLQDQIVIQTTNLKMGAQQAGEQIVEQILLALNGANAALQEAS